MNNVSALNGIEISAVQEDLICYSYDSSYAKEVLPLAVAWPRTTEEVSRLLRYASESGVAVVPRGAGTGMAGASIASDSQCIIISLEKMKKILSIDTRNMTVIVEPGVVNGNLQKELEYLGFFYPPDPASMNTCTIGGNVACNAGGPRALKYGVTRDFVLGMETVLPDGTVLPVGGRTYKRVVGYDLRNLFIGSEGTLAIYTKIYLRMLPLPEDVVTLLVLFKDVEAAGSAVAKIVNAKVIPRTLEIMDRECLKAVEHYKPTGLPTDAEALLLVELDGYPATISKEAERVVEVCRSLGGEAHVAEDEAAREKLWEARRAISPALYRIRPDKINQDIVVPRNRIPSFLLEMRKITEETGIPIVNFGHAGDGNIHCNIMMDAQNEEERETALGLTKRIFEVTLSLGGSISGEHGIGTLKAPYLSMELREREIELMRGIKGLFDPRGILNPGKIFS